MNLSIVIPVYNEVENLLLLHQAIHAALGESSGLQWEMVLIDDGSKDGSLEVLEKLANQDPVHTRVVEFRRNFGQTAAIAAGIDHSLGEVIVLMDADLQNDPQDIPMMLEKIDEGYDVVSGWRINRQDTFITRTLPSQHGQLADLKRNRRAPARLRLHSEGLPARSPDRFPTVWRDAPLYPGLCHTRSARGSWKCRSTTTPGNFGKTKYGLTRTIKVVLDLFTVKFLMSYANKPIYLFGGAGILMIVFSA